MNPGIYDLGDVQISNAVTNQVITDGVSTGGIAVDYISGLGGMQAGTIQANFNYGGSGLTAKVDIETSFDQGVTWVPVARFAFTTVSATKLINLSALTAKTTMYAPVVLSDDTVVDGFLGDLWRAKLTTTGTYTGSTTLAVRLCAR